MNTCQGCGEPISMPPRGWRKWCSDACRKRTLYAKRCVDCGYQDNGSEGPRDGEYVCVDCQHERDYGNRYQRIERMWNRGVPLAEIARHEGMSVSAVQNVAAQLRKRGRGGFRQLPKSSSQERWQRVAELWNAGHTARQIAEEIGSASGESVAYMLYTMRRRGVDLERRGKGWRRKVAA